MGKTLGLGLIGCGAFGRFCAKAYQELEGIRLAAGADAYEQARKSFSADFGVPAYSDAADLAARPDVDIIHIATPPSTHHGLVMSCIARGKHVLCEKPLAMSVAQADEMLAAAERANLVLAVNFVLRYNQVTHKVKEVIDSEAMGQVTAASMINCAADSRLPPSHWFWDKKVSGGIFTEHGVHFFDLYRHWLGEGEVVRAYAAQRRGTSQEDRVTCLVQHAAGAIAQHYHAFDQVAPLDRTEHRLIFELGDLRVLGWIPLTIELDAAVSDTSLQQLAAIFPESHFETLRQFGPGEREIMGRGREHLITRRVRLSWTPRDDKQAVYAQSVRDLMSDQLAYLQNRGHRRIVTEENGRQSLAPAEQAARLAG